MLWSCFHSMFVLKSPLRFRLFRGFEIGVVVDVVFNNASVVRIISHCCKGEESRGEARYFNIGVRTTFRAHQLILRNQSKFTSGDPI